MLTGEPMPVAKHAGRPRDRRDPQRQLAALLLRAERGRQSQTVLAQIVQLVAQAQRTRAPMQRHRRQGRILVRAGRARQWRW
jgi:Cu+-exporting ATPase